MKRLGWSEKVGDKEVQGKVNVELMAELQIWRLLTA